MRLYNIFYICKIYLPDIKKVKVVSIQNQSVDKIENWKKCKEALEALMKIECLSELSKKAYFSIGGPERELATPDVSKGTSAKFTVAINNLSVSMETLLKLHDSLEIGESESGIDIKIPKCESLKEYMDYLKDINFILTQCPFLLHEKEQVKFNNVDVGSQWLAFSIIGSTGLFFILNNLASIIQKVIAIKSNLIVYKQQEELLKEYKRKGEIADENIEIFKKLKDVVVEKCVEELEAEISPLKDGEERDKVKRTIEVMSELMQKGVEIYSSIETPNDVKVLFPFEKDTAILPDNIMKMIEEKQNKE